MKGILEMSLENETTNLRHNLPKKGRSDNRSNRNLILKISISIIAIIVWVGLLYGGYTVASNYFEETHSHLDQQIQEIKLQNQEVFSKLGRFNEELKYSNDELLIVRNELDYIKEALEITGETITGSDKTRLILQERMAELDKRLNQLQSQLIKLEEAARAH